MKLGGIRTTDNGFHPEDPPFAFGVLVHDVLTACRREGVEPVGTLSVGVVEDRFTDAKALRWDLTATAPR